MVLPSLMASGTSALTNHRIVFRKRVSWYQGILENRHRNSQLQIVWCGAYQHGALPRALLCLQSSLCQSKRCIHFYDNRSTHHNHGNRHNVGVSNDE